MKQIQEASLNKDLEGVIEKLLKNRKVSFSFFFSLSLSLSLSPLSDAATWVGAVHSQTKGNAVHERSSRSHAIIRIYIKTVEILVSLNLNLSLYLTHTHTHTKRTIHASTALLRVLMRLAVCSECQSGKKRRVRRTRKEQPNDR